MFGSPPIPVLKCAHTEKLSNHGSGVEPKVGKQNTIIHCKTSTAKSEHDKIKVKVEETNLKIKHSLHTGEAVMDWRYYNCISVPKHHCISHLPTAT